MGTIKPPSKRSISSSSQKSGAMNASEREKSKKERILLVEDNKDHALLAKKALEVNGTMVVDHVVTVADGFRVVKSKPYDLIICDYDLPDVNGLEFLRQVCEEGSSVPFVMLTGAGDERIAVAALQGGAYNYLVKDDIYLRVLQRTIKETLARFRADRERLKLAQEIWEKNRQLEEMNQDLQNLDKLKNEFMASVTHEFRTPLNSAKESIKLLTDGIVSLNGKEALKFLKIAQKSIGRLGVLIDDLLDFNKLESGKLRMEIRPYSIEDIIREAVNSVFQLAESHRIKIVVSEWVVPKVVCDQNRIIQVLVNLLGNAIKFTAQGGTITISAEKVLGDKVKVNVKDNGIGIDPGMQFKIFNRFVQADHPTSPEARKGTGLGLAICQQIIERHEGSIWVESQDQKGSTFMFTLPTKKC